MIGALFLAHMQRLANSTSAAYRLASRWRKRIQLRLRVITVAR